MRTVSNILRTLRLYWLEFALLVGLALIMWWAGSIAEGFISSSRKKAAPEAQATVALSPSGTPSPTSLAAITASPEKTSTPDGAGEFSGISALQIVSEQMSFGSRPTGSEASAQLGDYVLDRLKEYGWATEVQEFTYQGVSGRNLIGKGGEGPVVIVGAHYDTRKRADRDPNSNRQVEPVPGANDGASGVAVLLELARVLEKQQLRNEVWLTFFDAEDNGGLGGWPYSVGSEHMASDLSVKPVAVVVVDMIGDADQEIYKERNSTPELQDRIWALAATLGYGDYFIPEYKWSITDDHLPFLRRGHKAVDLIDFDYPFYHSTADTLDKVSASSLERVGRVIQVLLETGGLSESD